MSNGIKREDADMVRRMIDAQLFLIREGSIHHVYPDVLIRLLQHMTDDQQATVKEYLRVYSWGVFIPESIAKPAAEAIHDVKQRLGDKPYLKLVRDGCKADLARYMGWG